MVGMAMMFIFTIAIGMFIQPAYDVPEARAFGEEGTTKSSFIPDIVELVINNRLTAPNDNNTPRSLAFDFGTILSFSLSSSDPNKGFLIPEMPYQNI